MSKRMKTLGLIFGAAMMVTAAASSAFAAETEEKMVGAYEGYMQEGLTPEAQEAFDKAMAQYRGGETLKPVQLLATQVVAGINYKIVCEAPSPAGTEKKIVTIYQDLDGNCEVTDTQKVIAPKDMPGMMEANDFTAKASFTADDFNFGDKTLKFRVFGEDLYDMVDMTQMEVGDVVFDGERYVTVESLEESSFVRTSQDGAEEKVATIKINEDKDGEMFFVANEGGTWLRILNNDLVACSALGEKTLPMADNMTFVDCTTEPGEKVEVSFDQLQEHEKEMKEQGRDQYSPYDTTVVVENGKIVSIVRSWRP